MKKLNTFEDAEHLIEQGIDAIISSALVGDDAAELIQFDDLIDKQARITTFVGDGTHQSDHLVLECQSIKGNTYILCIQVGNGCAMTSYSPDDLISFFEECKEYDIVIERCIPILVYSYRGISLVSEDFMNTAF
jgi:hypothetical protein